MAPVCQVTERAEDRPATFHPLFDDEDADIILSLNDNTLFRLPRLTLKRASGYFRRIFIGKPTEPHPYTIPFPAATLEYVLLMISGLPVPNPSSLDEIEAAIEVMRYLDTPGPLAAFHNWVLPMCRDHPIRIYGIGTKLGWPEITKLGAKLSLPLTLLSKDPDIQSQLSQLSSPALLDLLKLHHQRRIAIRDELRGPLRPPVQCSCCSGSANENAWIVLVSRLMEEIESDSSGARILGQEVETWLESQRCWDYRCGSYGCAGIYSKEVSLKMIRDVITRLTNELGPYASFSQIGT